MFMPMAMQLTSASASNRAQSDSFTKRKFDPLPSTLDNDSLKETDDESDVPLSKKLKVNSKPESKPSSTSKPTKTDEASATGLLVYRVNKKLNAFHNDMKTELKEQAAELENKLTESHKKKLASLRQHNRVRGQNQRNVEAALHQEIRDLKHHISALETKNASLEKEKEALAAKQKADSAKNFNPISTRDIKPLPKPDIKPIKKPSAADPDLDIDINTIPAYNPHAHAHAHAFEANTKPKPNVKEEGATGTKPSTEIITLSSPVSAPSPPRITLIKAPIEAATSSSQKPIGSSIHCAHEKSDEEYNREVKKILADEKGMQRAQAWYEAQKEYVRREGVGQGWGP